MIIDRCVPHPLHAIADVELDGYGCKKIYEHTVIIASFPGPAQLSVASSTVKPGIFSHVSDIGIERVVESV